MQLESEHPKSIDVILKEKFGIADLSFAGLDTALETDEKQRVVLDFLEHQNLQDCPEELALWGLARTIVYEQAEAFNVPLQRIYGERFPALKAARSCAYVVEEKITLENIKTLHKTFIDNNIRFTDNYFHIHFMDCGNVETIVKKMDIYEKLTRGDLRSFYTGGSIPFARVLQYDIIATRGFHEHEGGFCLKLQKESIPIMHVGGKLVGDTHIISIQGKKSGENNSTLDNISAFEEAVDMHPANFLVLAYLKIGQNLGHETVNINVAASHAYNNQRKNSALYDIPRNYFRLRADPQTRKYNFDGTTRDKIINKFSKNALLKKTFDDIDLLLQS
jgi:hypothetical protein